MSEWVPSTPAVTDKNVSYPSDVLGLGKGGEPLNSAFLQLKKPSYFLLG